MSNIGVNVLEVEGTAAPTIVAAPVSTAGVLIGSERGVPNTPVQLRKYGDFVTAFGSYTKEYFGAHALNGFFQNGGAEAWAVRVVGAATAASATLKAGAANVMDVHAGIHGQQDPGLWGNSLSVRVEASPQGSTQVPAQILSTNAEPFALQDNAAMAVTVNGGTTPVNVQFKATEFADITQATASEVARVIDRASPSLRAAATPGHRVLISSGTPGTASRLAVAAGAPTDASVPLGFTGTTANSDQGIPAASSTLVGVNSPVGFEPGAAARIETHGRVVAPNALGAPPAAPPPAVGIDVAVNGGAAAPIRFAASDFSGGWPGTLGEIVAAINR